MKINKGELKTKVLMRSRYKGKGRPCKTDYIICKFKDELDVLMSDMLSSSYSTNYINN